MSPEQIFWLSVMIVSSVGTIVTMVRKSVRDEGRKTRVFVRAESERLIYAQANVVFSAVSEGERRAIAQHVISSTFIELPD